MAEVIGGFCASHAPGQIVRRTLGGDAADRFMAAQQAAAGKLRALEPDVVVICSGEHFTNFQPDLFPQATIGTGPAHMGPAERWMNMPMSAFPGHPNFARHLADRLLGTGFDPSTSNALLLDHGMLTTYLPIDSTMTIPLVPIIQNTLVSPMMPLRRCHEMGVALHAAICSFPEPLRVAVVGAGGLSHWIGTPRDGVIDEQFDRWFLERIAGDDMSDLLDLPDSELDHAGTGAHEVRSWITAVGALGALPRRVTVYEPIGAWLTGMSVMECGLAT
ncbi:MAG: Extradiol ring-cleavage dioxygenase class protein subunit [Sphingomonas bacterium]|jgi:hypothetical protein|uniref:DODA-type extradiol aromatic ring-opening family dioxygenase n=1 Tax=Sphingomonas bacterium TaxID=1895847 RepID=UPI00260A5ACC|nr:hypothetical protein [Sphingomonas bacterium]MDB5695023.1 Extradiol ring-cleavage dioxygenase class protein subunit [Sphingomonas bacterium]